MCAQGWTGCALILRSGSGTFRKDCTYRLHVWSSKPNSTSDPSALASPRHPEASKTEDRGSEHLEAGRKRERSGREVGRNTPITMQDDARHSILAYSWLNSLEKSVPGRRIVKKKAPNTKNGEFCRRGRARRPRGRAGIRDARPSRAHAQAPARARSINKACLP
jgi:hypothetical protein